METHKLEVHLGRAALSDSFVKLDGKEIHCNKIEILSEVGSLTTATIRVVNVDVEFTGEGVEITNIADDVRKYKP